MRFDAKAGRTPVRKHALAVNVQHLPGWDREVHSPQPEGQPGPRHRDQHGVEAPPYNSTTAPNEATVPTLSPPETPRSSVS
jgi:hypothetical protein